MLLCVSKSQLPTQDLAVAHLFYPALVAHSAPGIVEEVHHLAQVADGVPVEEPNLHSGCNGTGRLKEVRRKKIDTECTLHDGVTHLHKRHLRPFLACRLQRVLLVDCNRRAALPILGKKDVLRETFPGPVCIHCLASLPEIPWLLLVLAARRHYYSHYSFLRSLGVGC